MAPYRFFAFGLRIEADAPIPGFARAANTERWHPDLRLHMGARVPDFAAQPPEWTPFWRSQSDVPDPTDVITVRQSANARYMSVSYADGTEFVLRRSGDEVWATWPIESSLDDTATYLLGPILGFALRLRHVTCLHASAVVSGSRVVAMVGAAGMGKSTTAGALALRGLRVIADDVVVLDGSTGGWRVFPSVPGVRLWEDSVQMLLGNADALPRLSPGWEKRVLDLRTTRAGFDPEHAEPLGAVYVLTDPDVPGPTLPARLSPRDALLALVAETYANVLLDAEMRKHEFEDLSALARVVPVWRVAAPGSARALERFCATVEAAGRTADLTPVQP